MKKETVKPSTLGWPDEWSLIETGLSQSMWSDWMSCHRMLLFKINGYAQPLKEEKVHFGNLVHYINDKAYSLGRPLDEADVGKLVDEYSDKRRKEGTLLTQEQMEVDAAKAHGVMTIYFQKYLSDFTKKKFTGVERYFEQVYDGVRNRGKMDGQFIAANKKWLMEHKTKGKINEDTILVRLMLDFQNLFYILNDELETKERAIGVLYNVVRNPGMKLLAHESIKGFFKRIKEFCQSDLDHSFKRWETVYTESDMAKFKNDLGLMTTDIKLKIGKPVACNRFSCDRGWPCEFLRACSEDSMANLTKSKEAQLNYIFPELKEVRNAGSKSSDKEGKAVSRRVAVRRVTKGK